jgi:hypothetical protein
MMWHKIKLFHNNYNEVLLILVKHTVWAKNQTNTMDELLEYAKFIKQLLLF